MSFVKEEFDLRKKLFILVGILILIVVIGIASNNIEYSSKINQSLDLLKNSDGKIIAQKQLDIMSYAENKFTGAKLQQIKENRVKNCKYYRIRYLSDGLEVVGFIIRPKEKGNYPVIIFNRGGNREYGKVNKQHLVWLSSFASKGYVVIASQYRGVDGGEGKEEFGGKDINDVLNLMSLVENLDYTNPKNIGMLGASRGGMMTYLAIKNNIDINAAVVISGLSNLIQNYKEREQGMKNVYKELIGGPPSEYEQQYKKRSAYYWPEKIDVPVLIMHGKKDRRVNISQAKNLSEKLEKAGRKYKLLIFPNAYHGLRTKWRKRNNEIMKWFRKYLKN